MSSEGECRARGTNTHNHCGCGNKPFHRCLELLSRADLASGQILPHVDYEVSLTVQAVPLLNLLAAFSLEELDWLEASATDGFVAQIFSVDRGAKKRRSGSVDRGRGPKPSLAQAASENISAGPFYLAWQISSGLGCPASNGLTCWKD